MHTAASPASQWSTFVLLLLPGMIAERTIADLRLADSLSTTSTAPGMYYISGSELQLRFGNKLQRSLEIEMGHASLERVA